LSIFASFPLSPLLSDWTSNRVKLNQGFTHEENHIKQESNNLLIM